MGFVSFILATAMLACHSPNHKLQPQSGFEGWEPSLGVDKDSTLDDGSFITHAPVFLDDTVRSKRQVARMTGGAFLVAPCEEGSHEFVLFDFGKPAMVTTVVYLNKKYRYECRLEGRHVWNHDTVFVYRIEKFYQLPESCGGDTLDLVLFATRKNGVIGSYHQDIHSKNVLGHRGNILPDILDYSNTRFVKLCCSY